MKQTQKQQTTAPKQQGVPSQKAWASLQKAKTTTIGLPLPCCPSQGAAGCVAPNACLARAAAAPRLAHSNRAARAGHASRLRWKPGQSSLQGVLGQKLYTHTPLKILKNKLFISSNDTKKKHRIQNSPELFSPSLHQQAHRSGADAPAMKLCGLLFCSSKEKKPQAHYPETGQITLEKGSHSSVGVTVTL